MMSRIAPYAKALTAALIAGLAALFTGLDDSAVDWQEAITALIAFLVGLGGVWAIPNAAST
jgi:hypothetical protein